MVWTCYFLKGLFFVGKNIGQEKESVKEKTKAESNGKEAGSPRSHSGIQGMGWVGVSGWFADSLNFLPT